MKRKAYHIFCVGMITFIIGISLWQIKIFYSIEHRKPAYYIEYEIQPDDCVDKIAEEYKPEYMRLDNFRSEIQVINNIQEMIYPGTVLKIPIYNNF